MATYYVQQQGARVHKEDERLVVRHEDKIVAQIPLHQLEQLVVTTDVQVTSQAIAQLLKSEVDVVYMTRGGRVLGRLIGDESKFAELRLRQLEAMSDAARNLALAKRIVAGKLANQLMFLETSKRRLKSGDAGVAPVVSGERAHGSAVRGLREMLAQSIHAADADSLRGYEGRGAAWYWPAFRHLLSDAMGFSQRQYHPAPDPVNAILSFGYALLQKDVQAAVRRVGLDPYLGFFHTVQYGRPSLALDVMEEFRPIVVDALVVGMINLGRIKARDFRSGGEPERPVSLQEEALKRVIGDYETRVAGEVVYPLTQERTTLRRCIELQVRQLARVLRGELREYQPYLSEG
ncbi:MAG: CRISPR-associated endonuclease Cas1 [Chloroflexi bacterium]|nr:CRISPR-associated endonuclease Cas1 [Chloroflexota bacterium]